MSDTRASGPDNSTPICQPPKPAPLAPCFAVPAGACDCHAHVFAPPGRYPYRSDRRYTPAPAGLAEYCQVLAALGLQRAVIVQPTIYDGNQATLDALQAAGGSWRGVAQIGPEVGPTALADLHAAGFRGVRLHGRDGGLGRLEDVAAQVAPLGWHVQLHLDGCDLPELVPRLSRLPTDVVIDHFGRIDARRGVEQPGFRALLTLLETGRCWVKLSAPYRLGDPVPPYEAVTDFARMLVAQTPDRLLWGSDWPHSSYDGLMPDDGTLLNLMSVWAPDVGTREMILRSNPARLYGFGE